MEIPDKQDLQEIQEIPANKVQREPLEIPVILEVQVEQEQRVG
jgi:hypothetical protein